LTSSFCNNYNVPTLPWRQSQHHFFFRTSLIICFFLQ
jgi:hypothetical protein